MLERILRLLCPKDLKTVMLVCKRWNEAGSVPKLWSWVVFKINDLGHDNDVEHPEFLLEMIRLPRLQAARRILIEGLWVNNEIKLTLLSNALSHPGLKQLLIHGGDFRTVDPEVLAKFLTKMEEVDLCGVWMDSEQKRVFLSVLKATNKIKRFSWQDKKNKDTPKTYSQLPRAMKKIEELTLKLNLNRSTVRSLFKVLEEEDASVKSLSLDVDPVRPRQGIIGQSRFARLQTKERTMYYFSKTAEGRRQCKLEYI